MDPGRLPTGEQFALRRGSGHREVTAVVTELAASLRSLRVGGLPLVQEYADELGPPPGGAGIVMVPWPNRVAGARWTLDGVEQRLDVTEPSTGNAIHGLLRNTGYLPLDQTPDSVTLAATVFPQHGYPGHLGTTVRYALVDDGVEVAHTVVNHGATPAPVALGAHPYLRVGDTPSDDLVVTVAAETYLETDDRAIPVGERPVAGSPYDLRDGRRVGDTRLDTCFTDLTADADAHRHRLVAPDGSGVELWSDLQCGFVQVYANRAFPMPAGPGTAVAVEPMTAAPDALNSGRGLTWLPPGATWQVAWGIRSLRA